MQSLRKAVCHSGGAEAGGGGEIWRRHSDRGGSNADVSNQSQSADQTGAEANGAGLHLLNSLGGAAAAVLDVAEGGECWEAAGEDAAGCFTGGAVARRRD